MDKYYRVIDYGSDPNKLTSDEINSLAIYNSEVARGLVHNDEYKEFMTELQKIFTKGNDK